jgi:quercetin dioxygenase-like cupin family protein
MILMLVFRTESGLGQDATKVDSAHYKAEFENDQVRVLRITYEPGEKSVMHEHPNAVAIQVTGGLFKIGEARWTPAVKHLPENIGDKPTEVILVEIKVKSSAESLTASAVAQDATKVDPAHYKVELENEQVRVLRISYGPNEKSVMHEHPASVAVFLTGGKGQFTYPDGKTEEINWNAGQSLWLPAVKHQPENLTDEPFELIQIEMKVKGKKDKKE